MHPPVLFVKVDIDKIPDAARKYDIKSLPTFVFLKGGVELSRFSGADVNLLKSTIEENVQ